jgi:hypothetical protein
MHDLFHRFASQRLAQSYVQEQNLGSGAGCWWTVQAAFVALESEFAGFDEVLLEPRE